MASFSSGPRRAMTAPPSLKGRALRLLGTREYSRLELERKLAPHAEDPEALRVALDDLQAKGFINDQRVVESVLHRRAATFGEARIRRELQQKGLDADAASVLRGSELERARALWLRKFGHTAQGVDPFSKEGMAERARQMRFLAARGFGGDTIRRVVRGAAEDMPPEEPL